MKKILIYSFLAIVLLTTLSIYFLREVEKDRNAKQRYDNADKGHQKCVNVLSNSKFSHKSLSWKLDKCKAPEWKK